jgi:hypothetical protein
MPIVQNQGSSKIEEPVPTVNEVEQAINKIQNNTAPRMDFIWQN